MAEENLYIFWEIWIDHNLDTSPVGVEKIVIRITPDGVVHFTPMVFDLLTWVEGFNVGEDGFTCSLGDTFVAVTYDEAGNENTDE